MVVRRASAATRVLDSLSQAVAGHARPPGRAEAAAVLRADHASWLYALLARLDLPLHRDVQALVRRLVRRLLHLRQSGDALPAVQTLLVVAGRYHGQATPGELDGTEDCAPLD
ncbi:MAG: hypothetical protein AAFV49_23315, partial [Pseudomonadota bacterium]